MVKMNADRREKALEETREKLSEAGERDLLLIKAVSFLDQLEQGLNPEVERLRDWYSLHFPELVEEIGDDEEFVEILSRSIERDGLEPFQELAEDSTGMELGEEDREILEKTVENLKEDFDHRERLRDYIERTAEQEMPNLSHLLEPLLTARLVAHAGSLEELARSPASTIQMLGAEKALFRYLGGEGTAPKHGVLFQHRFVHSLPEEKRGKMARFLANKTAIAARLDFYGDKMKGEELQKEASEKYGELKDEGS